jgi:hypothetical protein
MGNLAYFRPRILDRSYLSKEIDPGEDRKDGAAFRIAKKTKEWVLLQDGALIENVYPETAPALVTWDGQGMLLFTADNGSENELQFTDIQWSHFDGQAWSTPLPVVSDTRAEFHPQLAVDGFGRVIAVWERIRDTALAEADLTEFASRLEIVWAVWDDGLNAWSEPQELTENEILDCQPLLAGPMSDGSLALVWIQSPENRVIAGLGEETTDRVIWSRFEPDTQTWSVPAILLESQKGRISQTLGAGGNEAAYVWARDMDGDLTSMQDQELFLVQWIDDEWEDPVQLSNNLIQDCGPALHFTPDGKPLLVWKQGHDLVFTREFSSTPQIIRLGVEMEVINRVQIASGNQDKIGVFWTNPGNEGPALHYRLWEPESDVWSEDLLLFDDPLWEGPWAQAWLSAEDLLIACSRTHVHKVSRSVELAPGEWIPVEDFPEPVRTDLEVQIKSLGRDLELTADNFEVESFNGLPGDLVHLRARIVNRGELPVPNPCVAFFAGNPDHEGQRIGEAELDNWIAGGGSWTAELDWSCPASESRQQISAWVDPDFFVEEKRENNNKAITLFGGTDLVLELLSNHVMKDGSMRVRCEIWNGGFPTSSAGTLLLSREDNHDETLFTVEYPALEPGERAQVEMSPGPETHAEGVERFLLELEPAADNPEDCDVSNNSLVFSSLMRLDQDGDGIGDGWEKEYGLDPQNPADALLDLDGDGRSMRDEYVAGTDPWDSSSFLQTTMELSSEGAAGPQWTVQLTWGAITGRRYSIEWSADQLSWVAVASQIPATPPENTMAVIIPDAKTHGFFRVRVEQ